MLVKLLCLFLCDFCNKLSFMFSFSFLDMRLLNQIFSTQGFQFFALCFEMWPYQIACLAYSSRSFWLSLWGSGSLYEHACLSMHPAAFIGSPGAEVTCSCEVPCGCLELNLDPLDTQLVFLAAEPSLRFLSAGLSHVSPCLVRFISESQQSSWPSLPLGMMPTSRTQGHSGKSRERPCFSL